MVSNIILEDDLKRIGFVMNYDSKNLVSENFNNTKNLVIQNKIENLFIPKKNTEIISETELKRVFKEVWETRKQNVISEQWVRGSDQIGYWKILFDQLKKGGIPVQWQVANDPVKSAFMYWGPWVINKDTNKNGGWPITFTGADKKLWLFKFQGGKYAGQPASNMIIESKFINPAFNLGQWGKLTGAAGGPQFTNLMKTKPKKVAPKKVAPKKTEKGWMDTITDVGKDVYDTSTKTLDSAVNWADKNLGFDSDWWLLVPGLNGLKLTRDQYKAFRFFQTATPDQMIEGIRDFLGGVKGSIVTIGLDAVGIGEIAEPIIWSLMLAYDCYKYIEKGILNLIDIIADCAAILSAGLGAWIGKAWKGLAKPGKEAAQEAHVLIAWLQKNLPSFYPYVQNVVKNIDTLIRKAATNAKLGLRMLKQKVPVIGPTIKAIEKGITYIPKVLDKIKKSLTKSAGETGQKVVMTVGKDRLNAVTGGYAGYAMDPTGKLKKSVMNTVLGPSIWGSLKKALGVTKSPKLKIQDASNGEAYFITGYDGGKQLGFYKNGSVKFWNGKTWSKGGKWDPNSSDKDGQLIGGWLTDKVGTKVSLASAIGNAYKHFG
jgi:hypothetical protein